MYSIVIDFGGTYIKLGLIQDGKMIEFHHTDSYSDRGLLPRLNVIEEMVAKILQIRNLTLNDCAGLGVAIPGIVDFYAKKVIATNAKYNDAVSFSFERWAKEAFGLPIVIENDAKAALIGEVTYGIAKNESDAVMVIFGTGIGTAAYINNRLLRGKHHQAGCLGGHISTQYNGLTCTCGNVGCLEAQSANWALPMVAKKRKDFTKSLLAKKDVIDYKSIIECAQQEDLFSCQLLNDLIDQWSAGIVNLIHAYDPNTVILSGGLMKSKDILLPKIINKVHERAWTPWGKVKFEVAENPQISVLLGLDALVKQTKNSKKEGDKYESAF